MDIRIDELIGRLLEEMQRDTALTEEEKEKARQALEEKLTAEGIINEQE